MISIEIKPLDNHINPSFHEAASSFYGRFGFKPIPNSRPPLMVLPVKQLLAAVAMAANG